MHAKMKCKSTKSTIRCGKCLFVLNDESTLKNMTSLQVSRALVKVVQCEEFRNVLPPKPESRKSLVTDLPKLNISCIGSVIVDNTTNDCVIDLQTVKQLYLQVTSLWHKCHASLHSLQSSEELLKAGVEIEYAKNIRKLTNFAIGTESLVKDLTTCNGACTDIISSKDISNCSFKLRDTRKISKFNATGLAIILLSISDHMCKVEESGIFNGSFINIQTATVSCNAVVSCSIMYDECTSTLETLKDFVNDYCTYWTDENRNKQADCRKIKLCMNIVAHSRSIKNVSDALSALYNDL